VVVFKIIRCKAPWRLAGPTRESLMKQYSLSPTIRRYGQLSLIILAAGSIFPLVYLRQNFEVTLVDALGISGADLRDCYAMLGFIFVMTYLPSGWLADRVSPRLLMSFSLAATGLLGIWYAGYPDLWAVRLIFMGWGISTGLTFWAAMLKAVAVMARPHEQGRFFGLLDGGRGLVEAILATIAIALFAWAMDSLGQASHVALQKVMIFYIAFTLLLAPAVWLLITDTRESKDNAPDALKHQSSTLTDLKTLARKPEIWLAGFCILTGYQLFWATYSFSAYLQNYYGLTAVTVGSITVAKLWMRPIGATMAGFAGDIFARELVLAILLLGGSAALLTLSLLATESHPTLLLCVVLAVGLLTYGIRGIYWALLESCHIEDRTKGLALGWLSLLGYSPDFYQPLISARLLEWFPGKLGYDLYYWGISVMGIFGAMAALALYKLSRRTASQPITAPKSP